MGVIRLTRIPTEHGFQILDALIDGNAVADLSDLVALPLPPDLDWREGVLINGRAPVWFYAWAVEQCPEAAWLAVMDPRHGGVVVRTGDGGPAVGSVIPFEILDRFLPRRQPLAPPAGAPRPSARKTIAFVGPPHSGKSVLVHALYEALREALPAESFQRDVSRARLSGRGGELVRGDSRRSRHLPPLQGSLG